MTNGHKIEETESDRAAKGTKRAKNKRRTSQKKMQVDYDDDYDSPLTKKSKPTESSASGLPVLSKEEWKKAKKSEKKKRDADPVKAILATCLTRGLKMESLPPLTPRSSHVPHAPIRAPALSPEDFKLAVKNALRYFPQKHHEVLAAEFADELKNEGHIYMRRFRPTEYEMKAYPVDYYPAKSRQAACIMLMIQNNLDPRVAQYPEELITYGGNGSVLSNWAQYHLLMFYLSQMTDKQTLTMYSGHPMGLFPSHIDAPRVVITNGMVIPNYSAKSDYDRMYAIGVTQYGQMTAGSYAYIGPQGIVHGTAITVLNAGRMWLGSDDLRGKVYVSSGLGGMSGAQGKAGNICGIVSVIAEVDEHALDKRLSQGWVDQKCTLENIIEKIKEARQEKKAVALAVLANIVDLWETLAEQSELLVELGSDQTSCHNIYGGGYFPVGLSVEQSQQLMVSDPAQFKKECSKSLSRQVAAINSLVERGMRFWDYGNCFLLESKRAGAEIMAPNGRDFRYPSYVQAIMGNVFSLGFGPFRWVCMSGKPEDLQVTDRIAAQVIRELRNGAPAAIDAQLSDNLRWIEQAEQNKLVVGSQARILYAHAEGRQKIAIAFNKAITDGSLKGPIVLSRDHHDVSGTDSPFRETSNIYDGSSFCADMAVQNVIGDSFRGATWVSLHNGGGCGWGEVINGGFGLVLDGTPRAAVRASQMLHWDVNNGVARRAWAGNDNAIFMVDREMQTNPNFKVTMPIPCDSALLDLVCSK